MNRFYQLLLTAFIMVVASWKISAQVQFSISPLSTNATVGQQVSFDLRASNFTEIVSFQYSFKFNTAELEFVGFGPNTTSPTFNLQDLNANSFNTTANTLAQGAIAAIWFSSTTNPVTLSGTTTLATLVFKSKVSKSVAIGFSDTPTDVEVTGPGVDNLPSGTPTVVFTPTLGTFGGGGGNACSPDTTPPTFSSCPQSINLTTSTNCATATWTTPTATDACGAVTVNLTSSSASGTCFPLGTSTVSYTATDVAGNKATCSFSVTVAQDNTMNPDPCVNNWNYPTNLGTETTVVLSEELVQKATDQACLRVMVSNFTLIQGLGFSLTWDPAKLEYVGIKNDKFNLPGASLTSLNLVDKATGKIGFSWDDPSTNGVTLQDQSVIFEICFKKLGNLDAPVTFTSTPVDINAVKEINSQSIDFTPNTRSGKVSLCGTTPISNCTTTIVYDKSLNLQQKIIPTNGEVCVDLLVNDFKNIDGLGMSITWDGTKLQYQRIEPVGITLDASHFNVIGNKIIISWDTGGGAPITVEDGKAIFRLCFQAVGGVGSITPITILPTPEVISGTPKTNVTFADGSVTVKASPIVTAINSSICGGSGTATANITPATGNYTYSWLSPTGSKMNGKQITITTPGIYKVTAVDNVSCLSGTSETTAIAIASPTLTNLVQDATGITLSTNALSSDVKWAKASNPSVVVATGSTFSSPEANTEYIVNVGTGACTKSQNIIALGVTNTESNAIKCGGEKTGKISLTISGGSNLSYKWAPNGETTQNLSNLAEGIYSVTITSADNKVNTVRSFTITSPDPLKILANPIVTNAPNGGINIEVTGGTGTKTYNWVGVGNSVSYTWPTPPPFTGAITQDLTGLEPGTYSVTVTDSNGCVTTTSHKIDVQPLVVKLQNNAVTHATCAQNNGSATLIVEGGSSAYNYLWEGPTKVGNTTIATNLAPGDYSISVSDQKYNLVTKYSLSIQNIGNPPIISIAQVVDAGENCKGAIDIAITDGVAPYTYKWEGPANNVPPIQDPTGLCEGTYSVTVTDNKGCTAVKTGIVVAGAARPCPTAVKITQPNCPDTNDGGIELTIVGGKEPFSFVWQKDGKKYAATSQNLSGLLAGTYSVTITDALNKVCSKDGIVVASKSDLKVDATVTDPVPANAKNGDITLIVSGGVGSKITYTWENNLSSSNSATGLKAGNYTVTITDTSTGCNVIKTVTVGDPGAVEMVIRSVFNGVNVRCFGMCNGIVEIKSVGDATPPLKYKWSNGDTSRIAKGLCVGLHKVTVTDSNGENFEGSVNLVGPAKIDAKIITDATDKSARLEVKGGTAPYVYRWHDYTTDISIKNQEIGRVFAMIIDANGCEASANGYIGASNTSAICLDASPIITPNGDSYNDDLEIFCLDNYATNKLQVFNRWGQEILIMDNYKNHSWKGTYANGKPLPNGPYFYVIEVFGDNPPAPQKGSFIIINEE